MRRNSPGIPPLFRSRFSVDYSAPFQRHLNRLEVEIGREDYRHLKQVELLATEPAEIDFSRMEEITGRLCKTTQNRYNRELLRRLNIRVYLDHPEYDVYYRLPACVIRFRPAWRRDVLGRFFDRMPLHDTGWRSAGWRLPGFDARFLPDASGGVLLLRSQEAPRRPSPLLTATHGPYDPHTFDVVLYLLRAGCGGAALINLGFSGREPLTDENLEKLKDWGVPLNPSSIDVIYPYTDVGGHPHCYKLEEELCRYVALLEVSPSLIIDVHGCVGTHSDDNRLIVGLGGSPPYPGLSTIGFLDVRDGDVFLHPRESVRHGLSLLRRLSTEMCIQFCTTSESCYHFRIEQKPPSRGRAFNPRHEARSLLKGEPRFFLPAEQVRWLPGARGNAIQRREAQKLGGGILCLHVEIPTSVRHRVALNLREREIGESLDSSAL